MSPLVSLMVVAQRSAFDQARPVLFWVGALIVVVLIGGVVILKVRERTRGAGGRSDARGGASFMEQLHEMRRSGTISDEEYQTMRARVGRKIAAEMGVGRAVPGAATPNNPRGGAGPSARSGDEAVAPPGYDLTGERLPDPPRAE